MRARFWECIYRLSNGVLYKALKRLAGAGFTEVIESNVSKRPGKQSQVYRINGVGKGTLKDELDKWEKLAGLGRERGARVGWFRWCK